jgi:putative transcriptional regulator
MKINEIIRYHRKKESLTQEQVANYLNVSAPAVNKWEKGASYPDITLLAPLARLLKIDVNTLLAYNEDLTDETVDTFIEEVMHLSDTAGYHKAYERGQELIMQYPSCDTLIFWISTALRIELLTAQIEDKETYERKIIDWLQLVSQSNKETLASRAKLDLSNIYCRKKDYNKAQHLLDAIPDVRVDKTFHQAILFKSSGQNEEAYDVCQGILLKNAEETLHVMTYMTVILCEEKKFKEAEAHLERAKKLVDGFDLGTYHKYPLELLLAKETQDKERAIACLRNMMSEARSMDHSQKSKFNKHAPEHEKNDDWYRNIVIEIIKNDASLEFVKDDPRIKILIGE